MHICVSKNEGTNCNTGVDLPKVKHSETRKSQENRPLDKTSFTTAVRPRISNASYASRNPFPYTSLVSCMSMLQQQ